MNCTPGSLPETVIAGACTANSANKIASKTDFMSHSFFGWFEFVELNRVNKTASIDKSQKLFLIAKNALNLWIINSTVG
jgi:hypothetical protein